MCVRDGHAHRCVCQIYPTYVGYSAILSDNAGTRIRMAIPNECPSTCRQKRDIPLRGKKKIALKKMDMQPIPLV